MAKKRKLGPKSSPTPDPIDQPTAAAAEPINDEPADDEPITDPLDEVSAAPDEAPPSEPLAEDDQMLQSPEETETLAGSASAVNDDNADDNDPASVQDLLDPLPKEQLADLLRDAAVKHPDVLEQIVRVADVDPAHRKIFVHGFGWDTTTEALAAIFRPYGEIEDCKAVVDKATGKSKGYGFILFKHRSAARRALKEPQKKIGNRTTSCQLASAGPVPASAPPVSEYTQRKIYISNVGADVDPQKLMQFFSKYGEIEEGPLGLDKVTGKPKGFCLFVYKTVESATKALEEPHKDFEGCVLHCQKAIDGPKPNKLGPQFQQGSAQILVPVGAHGPHFQRNANAGMMGGMGGHVPAGVSGHLMAPSAAGSGFNPSAQPAAAGLNPALEQALTAFLATQGAGLGLTNLLGGLGSAGMNGPMVNQGGPSPMVNNGMQGMNPGAIGGYGAPSSMQGGYGTPPTGYGTPPTGRGGGRGGAGRGRGRMGGTRPYRGR